MLIKIKVLLEELKRRSHLNRKFSDIAESKITSETFNNHYHAFFDEIRHSIQNTIVVCISKYLNAIVLFMLRESKGLGIFYHH